ncbi:hypothetical protein V8G54_022986 [Vigna mungo]|uniref:NB-ARC domain-containing protein n=1 Tax=Vigna mungo TaxID=3915 RepID=A0AAQ3N411_VIGMU
MLSKTQVDAESESQTSTGCTCKVLNFFKSSPIFSFNKEIEFRMKQNIDDLKFLSSQKDALGLKTASCVGYGMSNELSQKSQTTSLILGTDIYGRDDDKELIFDWLTSDINNQVHSLKQLHEDHCWKLFAEHAFRDDDDTQPNPECREIGRKIVKKCKGLPLALKTMESLLYNKSSVSEWETVFQSEIWEFSKEQCDIIPALALSYIHLPSHLKACFAYCALFPKDYEFEKEHLIQLWMTENFLQHRNIPEETCKQYFNDLLSRSFFQRSGDVEKVFVMHDLLNDLAKYVAGDVYFRWELGQTNKIQKVTRHFSVTLRYNEYFDGFGSLCNTDKLRTFMHVGKLNNFYEHLAIRGLHDIENPEDALEAYLKNKTHLVRLTLEREKTGNSIDSKIYLYTLKI